MSALDKYTEAVATAQREVHVAEALLNEHKGKLRLAEEEVSDSRRRLDDARYELSNAAVAAHEAVHGKPVSIDDRFEFERRWDARVAEQKAKQEAYAAYKKDLEEKEKAKLDALAEGDSQMITADELRVRLLGPGHPDHPDHTHEDCCK